MKLIIQIPCLNEAETLPLVFEKMPKKIDGVDVIEFQIIDDGSTDDTIKVAKSLGVHHVVTSSPIGKNRRWLGRAFKKGVDNALRLGADIVVNTDGDNQYPSESIPDLIEPILQGRADIVIGDRQTHQIDDFSTFKKFLQKFGSRVTSFFAGSEVPDAVSGFRAYSRNALMEINIMTNYTYTVDTIMQANKKGLDFEWVKITTNRKTRESRLIKSLSSKVRKSGGAIIRMYVIYEPFRTFTLASSLIGLVGMLPIFRFLFYYFQGDASGHIQSLILGSALVIISIQLFAIGVVAELLSVNRRLLEDGLGRMKKIDHGK